MESIWLRMLMAVLATWRITHLLAAEDGPAEIIARARRRLGNGFWGKLADCFNCLSLWVSAPAALLVTRTPGHYFLVWLALSGAACLLERLGNEPLIIHSLKGDEQP